jgi:hypothetical protein
MRLLSVVALIFLFNTAFMPVLGAAHEQSHQAKEGVAQITWSDDQSSNGLFQIVHDDHLTQADSSNSDNHHGDHQCHHISVMGMVGSSNPLVVTDLKTYNAIEPLLSFEFFPPQIEYPPRNA